MWQYVTNKERIKHLILIGHAEVKYNRKSLVKKEQILTRLLDKKDKGTHEVNITSNKLKCPDTQNMLIISEFVI